jgi:hypothetical protein
MHGEGNGRCQVELIDLLCDITRDGFPIVMAKFSLLRNCALSYKYLRGVSEKNYCATREPSYSKREMILWGAYSQR